MLRGDKLGNLPIQFATKLQPVINTTALGLEVPLLLFIRADALDE
jgi:hypothetical protein